MTFETLPGALQAEARALATELIAGGIDEIGPFWAHLERYGQDLTAEDRIASRYAVDVAMASLGSLADIEAASSGMAGKWIGNARP